LNRISKFTVLASLAFLAITPTIASSVFALVQQNAYVNSAHQFSINPPNSWSTDATGSFGTVVIFYGPTESNFRVNMNVVVEATSLSLADYVSAAKSQLSSGLTNYNVVSEGPITIGGLGAYQLVATFTQGTFSIKDSRFSLSKTTRRMSLHPRRYNRITTPIRRFFLRVFKLSS